MVPKGSPEVSAGPRKQVHRRLRPAEIEELVAGYQAGATACQLADRFRIHRTTVLSLLERQSVARRNRSLSFAQVVQARELYAARQSRAKVGKQLGCHASTVRLAHLKAGVRMRAGGSSGCKDVDPVGSCSGGEEPGVSWRKVWGWQGQRTRRGSTRSGEVLESGGGEQQEEAGLGRVDAEAVLNHAGTEHEGAGGSGALLVAEPEGEIAVEDEPRFVSWWCRWLGEPEPCGARTSATARFPDVWSPVVL